MKFSSALKFNAVADWWEEYIAYDVLKRYIYQLEKRQQRPDGIEPPYSDLEANEQTTLVDHSDTPGADSLFKPLLDKELQKIVRFYEAQEQELLNELAVLEQSITQQDEAGLEAGLDYMDEDEEDEEEDEEDEYNMLSRSEDYGKRSRRRRHKSTSVGYGTRFATGSIREESTNRRFSVSSSEAGDLDASVLSVAPRPRSASRVVSGSRHANSSMSPTGRARSLGSRLRTVKDITSTGDTIWTAKGSYALDTRLLFKRKITNLYITLSSLRSYVEVNYSGFSKILKKYDKVVYGELKDHYMHEVVETSAPFTEESKARMSDAIARLTELYTKCVTNGDKSTAQQQLKLYQREHIAWERNTVWRQMIGQQRHGTMNGLGALMGATLVQQEESSLINVPTPLGSLKLTKKRVSLTVALVVFIALLKMDIVVGEEANKCFAILAFSTILWATEAIPLFVTSLCVPLLLVCLRVIRDDNDTALSTPDATKYIFSVMFSPTIMLLIGGFTISSALSKTNIDRILITRVLSLAGSKPSSVLLAFMGVSCFASMWISNVAAPTLCFTLIRPILRTLPPGSAFAPALILAIALAANIGGQSSPISSPQNLIALAAMDPKLDWASWFAVALPVSIISILLIWLLLLVMYRPARSPDGEGEIEIRTIRPTRESFTLEQYWVTFVCLFTITLWCFEHKIEGLVGDMGVIAIIPIVAFFATGVLKKDDFEQFAWTIVFLAMGGIALGKGVTSSGLMVTMDRMIHRLLEGLSLYTVVLVLSPVVLIVSTFISHTIASVLLVPIAKEVGESLPGDHANLLIFMTGLLCSVGMGMPVSGFPNQTAAAQEDELGRLYLTNMDFLKNGVPASIVATLVVATVGFVLMIAIGL
ncbi:SPX domain-containing protein [Suillus plorans]|uniref:SPX domain-containing protein n=1 Tax=Suillus plorans TaxID=116603 RepID=A0A9P7AH11_9AGAM|nr:SPX domain-containing protein [Suillus plorans]KAG1789299.1 SPX domain-containing protein [Suillus plorans]